MNLVGRTIGNYEIVSPFGEGGMGELYLGRHTRLAREVIIKTIRTEDFSPRQVEHLRDRLEREAFIQSQLDHPNIVRVYDFIAVGDTTCIVMEYVPGRDLRKMITRETGPIQYQRAIKLFKQVLAAIDYAHQFIYTDKLGERHQGIIHRDLKPANILVTPEDVVKVTDFGIVKLRGVKGGTQMGFNPGTPEYMSPEQARGRELDRHSDIYSLGIVFYEMLTGRVPFEDDGSGTSDYEIRRGHIEMPVPPMSKVYPGISPELERIVFKALEKNPAQRYQTAQQFCEVIEEFEHTGVAKTTGRVDGRQTVVQADRGTGVRRAADAPTVAISDTVLTDPAQAQTNAANPLNATHNHLPPNNATVREAVGEDARPARLRKAVPATKSKMPLIVGGALVMLLAVAVSYWLLTRPTPPTVITGGTALSAIPPGMISIPGGTFKMGWDGGTDYEGPAHNVTVQTFLIDAYEVTNEQYDRFLKQLHRTPPKNWTEGKLPPGQDKYPVVNVTWYEARDYCQWLQKRLPTEQEWEYAARGQENLRYPYGKEWRPDSSSASVSKDQAGNPSPVGSYPRGTSPFGLFDMAGNAAEWTASDYEPYPQSAAKPDPGNKIVRGGSFSTPAQQQTATDRFFYRPNHADDFIGFRCAK